MTDSSNPKDVAATTECRVPLALLPPVGVVYQALGHNEGNLKYGPYNWYDSSIGMMTYLSALKRHIDKVISGEWFAKDSKAPHIGHVMATCAILADCVEHGTVLDDRPLVRGKPGIAPALSPQDFIIEELYANASLILQQQAANARARRLEKEAAEHHDEGCSDECDGCDQYGRALEGSMLGDGVSGDPGPVVPEESTRRSAAWGHGELQPLCHAPKCGRYAVYHINSGVLACPIHIDWAKTQ